MEIRGFYVRFSKRKSRMRRNIEKNLSDQIDALMKTLVTNRSKENIAKLYNLRSELNKIAEYRTKGAIIRSRTRWHEQGEKNTKYFLNLEKRQNAKTYISKLKSQDGQEITNSDEILNCQKLFYKNLYAAVPRKNQDDKLFFEDPNLPKLKDADLEELERPLTKQECFEKLKTCSKGKCPGSDGFTVEFFQQFWSALGEEMVQSFNYGIYFSYDEDEAFKKNFEQKLLSMKNLLSLWKLRNVTLYGRITISLKSLALSKLVYNTSVLATPREFVSSVQTTISRFVWNNKPKIKHTTMIGPKFKGGLDFPDFEIINNALKVTLIRRLYESSDNASWSHIPLTLLRQVGGKFLLECNYDLKYLKLDLPIQFYKDALSIWQIINQHTPENKEQILSEILWNNRFIKIQDLSIYYHSWHTAGVTRVRDIFCENNFLTFDDFCRKFAIKTNFLTYYGLCNAIPKNWIRLLKEFNPSAHTGSEYAENISLNKLTCKLGSRFLVGLKFIPPTAEQRMLQANFDKKTIDTIYIIPFKVTKDIRFSIFQFKIIHHILPTNATLFRDKIIEHDKCHLCDQKQTLQHLFVSCSDVQAFWQSFSNWWNVKNDDSIDLNDKTIIYGFTNNFSQQLGLNLCLMIAKYYIYSASREEEQYYFEAFLAVLKSKLQIEKAKCKTQINL